MREPRKFPAVLTGVMVFLIGESHSRYRSHTHRLPRLPSPLWRRWNARLCCIRFRDQDSRDHEPSTGQTICSGSAVPLFTRDSFICASTTLPGPSDHGEPAVQAEKWSGGPTGQVEQECIPSAGRVGLLPHQLGGRKGFGQIRQLCWELCLVSVFFCGPDSQGTDGASFPLHSVPLCFVYPAMLHLRAVAKTRGQILADQLMIIFGSAAFIFTTVQTIKVSKPSCSSMPADSL